MDRPLEQTTMRKLYRRLLPFAILAYFLCYLDRINVSFAALTMNKDLGLDASMFGIAAGAFFWGYFLFEVPSNIILERVGARFWIERIMVTWGIVSAAAALRVGPKSFMVARSMLGLAEAGFYPGLVLYFSYWFPAAAASFAWINSIGNLGGFLGPSIVGWSGTASVVSALGFIRSQPSR